MTVFHLKFTQQNISRQTSSIEVTQNWAPSFEGKTVHANDSSQINSIGTIYDRESQIDVDIVVQTVPVTKYLQVFSLGEPKLKTACVRHNMCLIQFSGRFKSPH